LDFYSFNSFLRKDEGIRSSWFPNEIDQGDDQACEGCKPGQKLDAGPETHVALGKKRDETISLGSIEANDYANYKERKAHKD
jgi:hypothetical protein